MRKPSVRVLLCCLGLAATAGLLLLYPGHPGREEKAPSAPALVRVWIPEGESALSQWLRRRSAEYEKETKARVYVRSASEAEADAALAGRDGAPPPDLLIFPRQGDPVALRGYALILRDDTAPAVTPSPTFSLFARPTPEPAPVPTPAPPAPEDRDRPALVPYECGGALPRGVRSASPLSDFLQGKADAALLTAGQAAQLPFGFRAWALPDGAGMVPFGARAETAGGEAFLAFLLRPSSQQALAEQGLYSPLYPLYQGKDSLYACIESGWNFPD